MNSKFFVAVAALALTFLSNFALGQAKLTSANITFVTPAHTDEKDWNTGVTVSLYLSDGTLVGTSKGNNCNASSSAADIAACFCCSKPLTNAQGAIIDFKTMFPDNGTERGPFSIYVSNQVDKQKIKTGFFKVSMAPVGNDRWIFVPKLTLTFSDGTTVTQANFPNTIIAQDASTATLAFY